MPNIRPQMMFFFGGAILMGAAMGVHESIFNNFLADTFALSAEGRGWLEFPRELPGLLVVGTAGLLAALTVPRLGLVAACIFAAGMVGMATLGGTFSLMVPMMMLASVGMHLLQPVGHSFAIGLSKPEERGRRMGQFGALGTAGMIAGTAGVWLLLEESTPRYALAFLATGAIVLLGGICYGLMPAPGVQRRRPRLHLRRKFRLYYLMEFLFGARKQIFLTFGPWVLIEVYGQSASDIAKLFMIAAFMGLWFKPLAGYSIDWFGERAVMVFDGFALAAVCVGYGYAFGFFGGGHYALIVASACFVLDNMLFALGNGRAVYMSRMADSPEEVTSTLAMGVSINHIASMLLPGIAGLVWDALGYERVFLGAAALALTISFTASFVPGRHSRAS